MTNRKFVVLGNGGVVLVWQLVLFPVLLFLLVKALKGISESTSSPRGSRRCNGAWKRRWKILIFLLAGLQVAWLLCGL